MAYKLIVSGDGEIIGVPEDEAHRAAWLKKIAAEFEKRARIKESRLLVQIVQHFFKKDGFPSSQEMIKLGFSQEFAEAWDIGLHNGMMRLSLMGVDRISADY